MEPVVYEYFWDPFRKKGATKYQKGISFKVSVKKSVEKAMVLQRWSYEYSNKQWFYSVGHRNYRKSMGDTTLAVGILEKALAYFLISFKVRVLL